jgi:hypothetical protein
MRQAVFSRNAPRLPIPDACVVDDRVERTEAVDLLGHIAGLRNAAQITDDDAFRSRHSGKRLFTPLLAARVQDRAMPLFDEELGRHLAQTVGRTCNKHACHNRLLSVVLQMHARPVKPRILNVNNQ